MGIDVATSHASCIYQELLLRSDLGALLGKARGPGQTSQGYCRHCTSSSSFPPLKEPELVFHCKPLPDMRETVGSSCIPVRGAWHETMRLSDRERQRLCASCKAMREARHSAPCDA